MAVKLAVYVSVCAMYDFYSFEPLLSLLGSPLGTHVPQSLLSSL
jgi:hypothetical protein